MLKSKKTIKREITVEKRPGLYFDHSLYSIRIPLEHSWILRGMKRKGFTHSDIDDMVHRRNSWAATRGISGIVFSSAFPRNSTRQEITDSEKKTLHNMYDFCLNSKDKINSTSVEYQSMRFYTNDLSLVDQLEKNFPNLRDLCNIKQAQVQGDRKTVILQKSKFQYRGYFRYFSLKDFTHKERLVQYLANLDPAEAKLSPTFHYWVRNPDQRYIYLSENFFIDYNSPAAITMLSLILPGAIRKTLEIKIIPKGK